MSKPVFCFSTIANWYTYHFVVVIDAMPHLLLIDMEKPPSLAQVQSSNSYHPKRLSEARQYETVLSCSDPVW